MNSFKRVRAFQIVLVFEERGKPEYPEKNLSEQGREPTTNSTHIWRRRRNLNLDRCGGRRALPPTPWAPLAPPPPLPPPLHTVTATRRITHLTKVCSASSYFCYSQGSPLIPDISRSKCQHLYDCRRYQYSVYS